MLLATVLLVSRHVVARQRPGLEVGRIFFKEGPTKIMSSPAVVGSENDSGFFGTENLVTLSENRKT